MLSTTKRIVVICATGLLAACGGGGGGGGGGNDAGTPGGTAAAPAAPASPAAPAPMPSANADFSPVAGLYDISTERSGMTDVGYLFITDQGGIEIYNDLNDAFAGAGSMNCFRRAISGDVSFVLDGKQLQRDGNTFQTTITGMELGQGMDQTLSLTLTATGFSASFGGITSGMGSLNIQSGNSGILRTNGSRTTAISIETIRAMICQ